MDDEDCNEDKGCYGQCFELYLSWTYVFGYGVYEVSHPVTCDEYWERVMSLIDLETNGHWFKDNCTKTLSHVDFNLDGWLNFREYHVIAQRITGYEWRKSLGSNCSQCVGMVEH